MKYDTLSRQARAAARARGHRMARFALVRTSATHPVWSTQCMDCHAFMQVNTNPYPNEIDIGGSAVAINCNHKE